MSLMKQGLVRILQLFKADGFHGKSLCMIGKTDIVVDRNEIVTILKDMNLAPEEKGWEDVITDPGIRLDSYWFFRAYGMEVHALDFSDYEGADIIWDLRKDIPEELCYRFDYVLDWGVSEHVFDPAKSISGISKLVKQGGLVIHGLPLAGWVDHGFWSFSPTVFRDFYGCNGFDIEHLWMDFVVSDGPWDPGKRWEDHMMILSPDLRIYPNSPQDWTKRRLNEYIKMIYSLDSVGAAGLYCVARRRECLPVTYPTQEDYRSVDPAFKSNQSTRDEMRLTKENTKRAAGIAEILQFLTKYAMHKNVILFGAGDCGRHVKDWLGVAGIPVYAFCDNDPGKTGKIRDGLTIISPEELLSLKNDVIVVVTSYLYAEEIMKQVREMGFSENEVIAF